MNIPITIINPIEYENWDDLLVSSKGNSFFHSSSWAKVINASYGYKPLYFSFIDGNNLKALFPIMEIKSSITGKRGISLPFSDNCELILSEKEYFKQLFDQILSFGAEASWRYLELRCSEKHINGISPYERYYSYRLDISHPDNQLFSKFRSSTQRNIKKAEKEGVKVSILQSLEAINEFYYLHCITRKSHGVPPQPFAFFKNIFNYIIGRNMGCIIIAYHHGMPIAGAVYFTFGDTVLFKYGASIKKYQHLRANNLVMWTAIQYYSEKNNFRILDMGRTEMNNNGLQQYKSGWGTEKDEVLYYRINISKKNYFTSKTYTPYIQKHMFHNMPIWLLRLVGNLSYKHIG